MYKYLSSCHSFPLKVCTVHDILQIKLLIGIYAQYPKSHIRYVSTCSVNNISNYT